MPSGACIALMPIHVTPIALQQRCARLMIRGQRRQRFREAQRGKSVSASPRDPPVGEMDEHTVLTLKAARV